MVTASFKSQEARDKWVGDLKAAVPSSRDEPGTLSYQLSQGVQDPLKVVIIERCVAVAHILLSRPTNHPSLCCRGRRAKHDEHGL